MWVHIYFGVFKERESKQWRILRHHLPFKRSLWKTSLRQDVMIVDRIAIARVQRASNIRSIHLRAVRSLWRVVKRSAEIVVSLVPETIFSAGIAIGPHTESSVVSDRVSTYSFLSNSISRSSSNYPNKPFFIYRCALLIMSILLMYNI
jgi:hypothetical protein